MSAADMQLVRDHVPGGHNLAVGEPFFLQEVYGSQYPLWAQPRIQYPLLGGETELVQRLETRYSGQKVVVTNGAKQAILAAMYALQRTKTLPLNGDYRRVLHSKPYWPTYPTMAELSHLTFKTESVPGLSRYLKVITSPNNPDGSLGDDRASTHWDIWDAAYASKVYGWDCIVPWHKISVWSAAKLYGPSGYRIGWLATPDPVLAQRAAEYVERTTSGVCNLAQAHLNVLLKNLEGLSPEEDARLQGKARSMLLDTSEAFMGLSKHFATIKGFPDTRQGMFAWVQAKDPERFKQLLARAKVKVVGGTACGGGEDWFRVSLGVTPNAMKAAVLAVQEAEDGPA
jgi:aspartate/methionine/tyrosine aminotransferase